MKIIGNVTCLNACEFEKNFHLYIRIDSGSSWEQRFIDASSFPAPFTFQPGRIRNGTISANIKGNDRNLKFYTITPVPVSSLNGDITKVIIIVKKCPSIQCKCPYGFSKDKNGCNACQCIDPCYSIEQKVCQEV